MKSGNFRTNHPVVIPSARLCENSFGALRPGSGRTVKYFTLFTSQPVRAEATRSMDGFSHSLSNARDSRKDFSLRSK